jgi:hypothetical protein
MPPRGVRSEHLSTLHDTDDLSVVSDDIRELVAREWPELVHSPREAAEFVKPLPQGAYEYGAYNCSPDCHRGDGDQYSRAEEGH